MIQTIAPEAGSTAAGLVTSFAQLLSTLPWHARFPSPGACPCLDCGSNTCCSTALPTPPNWSPAPLDLIPELLTAPISPAPPPGNGRTQLGVGRPAPPPCSPPAAPCHRSPRRRRPSSRGQGLTAQLASPPAVMRTPTAACARQPHIARARHAWRGGSRGGGGQVQGAGTSAAIVLACSAPRNRLSSTRQPPAPAAVSLGPECAPPALPERCTAFARACTQSGSAPAAAMQVTVRPGAPSFVAGAPLRSQHSRRQPAARRLPRCEVGNPGGGAREEREEIAAAQAAAAPAPDSECARAWAVPWRCRGRAGIALCSRRSRRPPSRRRLPAAAALLRLPTRPRTFPASQSWSFPRRARARRPLLRRQARAAGSSRATAAGPSRRAGCTARR